MGEKHVAMNDLRVGQYPVTVRRLVTMHPTSPLYGDGYVIAEFDEGYRHLFHIAAGYPRGEYARAGLLALVNAAMQGVSSDARLTSTGENFEELLRECVGVIVVANVVERASRNGRVYSNPTFRAGMQHRAHALLRRFNWGVYTPTEIEFWLGEAERQMESADRVGDTAWADGWAQLVAWCTQNLR